MEKIEFIIGRKPDIKSNEIPIIFDDYTKKVNESHCKITCERISPVLSKNTFYIEDLNSTTGTYVAGKRIDKKTKITTSSYITLGDKDIQFSLNNNKEFKKSIKNYHSNKEKNIIKEEFPKNTLKIDYPVYPVRKTKKSHISSEMIKSNVESEQGNTNKVVNVTLKGGLIGMLTDSPQNSLNRIIKKENNGGWRVIQIIPSSSGNILLMIFRIILLLITLFLYTTANGYYVVMEKTE